VPSRIFEQPDLADTVSRARGLHAVERFLESGPDVLRGGSIRCL
jgi:hypothetical protein